MTFELSINKNIINKGNPTANGWMNVVYTPDELIKSILKGFAYSQVLKDGAGTKKPESSDIAFAQLLSVDVDNEVREYDPETKTYKKRCKTIQEGYLTIDSILEDPWFHENALIVYTSPSHTDLQNKFRLIFLLPEKISDLDVYSATTSAFIEKFGADKSCKNIDRMFFGNTNAFYHIFGKQLSKNELNRLLENVKGVTNAEKTYQKFADRSDKLSEDQVAEMLEYIPKQMAYDEWGKIVSAIGNYFDENTAIRLVENWSPDTNKGTAYKVKHRSPKPNISSVIYYAAAHGFDKQKLYSRLSVSSKGKIIKDDNDSITATIAPENDEDIFVNTFDLDDFLAKTNLKKNHVFWSQAPKNKDAKEGGSTDKADYKINLNMLKFINYLQYLGFRKFWLDNNTTLLVQINDNIVDIVTEEKILDAVKNQILNMPYFVTEMFSKFDLIENLLQKLNTYSSVKYLRMVDKLEDDFIHDTKDEAFFFFSNTCVKATKNYVKKIKYKHLDKYIWKDQISDHEINNLFVDLDDDDNENDYLIGQFEQFIKKICSPRKYPEQLRHDREVDDKRFLSLCSAIGYMLHTYKDPTVTKAVILCEEKIAKADESNGRTGKGVTAKAISKMRKEIKFNGKQVDFNDKFFYQMVSPDTQILYFDDVEKGFNFEKLFSDLTEGISIQNKGQKPVFIPYEKSPKFMISTNSVLANDSDSHKARKFEIEYSDYFDSDYQPPHEFGNLFFEEGWDPESDEWDKFFSFMISCAMLYMNKGLMYYDTVNLEERKIKAKMPEPFIEFAEDMIEVLNSGEMVFKDKLYEEFVNKNKIYGPSGRSATTQVKTSKWFIDFMKFKNVDFIEKRLPSREDRRRYWILEGFVDNKHEDGNGIF